MEGTTAQRSRGHGMAHARLTPDGAMAWAISCATTATILEQVNIYLIPALSSAQARASA